MSATYYVERGRRPKNCWYCDGVTACRCDAVTVRAARRAARAVWRERMRDEEWEMPMDYFRELAADQFAARSLFREPENWTGFATAIGFCNRPSILQPRSRR